MKMCTFAYMYCFSYGLRHIFKLLKTNTSNIQTSCKRQGDKKRDLATHKGTRRWKDGRLYMCAIMCTKFWWLAMRQTNRFGQFLRVIRQMHQILQIPREKMSQCNFQKGSDAIFKKSLPFMSKSATIFVSK